MSSITLHVTLNEQAAAELAFLQGELNTSQSGAIRTAIARTAKQLAYRAPTTQAVATPNPAQTVRNADPEHCPDCSHALVPGEIHRCNFD